MRLTVVRHAKSAQLAPNFGAPPGEPPRAGQAKAKKGKKQGKDGSPLDPAGVHGDADLPLTDYDRPLNRRGRDDAPRMARWLRALGAPIAHAPAATPSLDWAWISGARRTRETAAVLLDALELPEHLQLFDDRLYLASATALLDVLRETPADRQWVMLVGHNPGVTDLVNLLAGTAVHDDLPTLAVVTFELGCEEWVDLRAGVGRLTSLMSPKRLPERG